MRKTGDPEFDALGNCIEHLLPLEDHQRERVLAYLNDRFGEDRRAASDAPTLPKRMPLPLDCDAIWHEHSPADRLLGPCDECGAVEPACGHLWHTTRGPEPSCPDCHAEPMP